MYVIRRVVILIVMHSFVIILIRCVKILAVIQGIVIILTLQGQITKISNEFFSASQFGLKNILTWIVSVNIILQHNDVDGHDNEVNISISESFVI